MEDSRVDIQDLLKAGSFSTARARNPDSSPAAPLEREPRFYRTTNVRVEAVNPSPTSSLPSHTGRPATPPPPPTVEDSEDIEGEFPDEEPKFRGEIDQEALMIEREDYVYSNNTEQRFVLLSDPTQTKPSSEGYGDQTGSRRPRDSQNHRAESTTSSSAAGAQGPNHTAVNTEKRFVLVTNPEDEKARKAAAEKAELEARYGTSYCPGKYFPDKSTWKPSKPSSTAKGEPTGAAAGVAAAAAAAAAGEAASSTTSSKSRRPSLSRRRSPHDLPRLNTTARDDFEPPRQNPRRIRSRSSASAYDPNSHYGTDSRVYEHAPRPGPDGFLSPEVIKHGPGSREQPYYYRQRNRSPPTTDRGYDSSTQRNQRSISPAFSGRSRLESEPPVKHVSRRSSSGSPRRVGVDGVSAPYYENSLSRRPASPRRRRESRSRRYDGYVMDDVTSDPGATRRRHDYQPIVIQAGGSYSKPSSRLGNPEVRTARSSRSRPRSTVIPSTALNQYPESVPRGPRSPNVFPGEFTDSPSVAPPYPIEDYMPTHEPFSGYSSAYVPGYAPAYSNARPAPGPQDPVSMPMPIPIRVSNRREAREATEYGRPQPISRSWQSSPPKHQRGWQADPYYPTPAHPSTGRYSITSVRRYFEDTQRSGVAPLPLCPRKDAVAGMLDWRVLRGSNNLNFNICPTCYNEIFSNTPYRGEFQPAPYRPHNQRIACSFGSFAWYTVAWLLTQKNRIPDLRLFHAVARVTEHTSATGEECPGARNSVRAWHCIRYPVSQRPVADFKACRECAEIVEVLLPKLEGVLLPLQEPPGASTSANALSEPAVSGVCALHFAADRHRFLLYFDALELASDAAYDAGTKPSLAQIAEDIDLISRATGCPRDRPARDRDWFIMDEVPHLSICRDCYEDVVYPLLVNDPGTAQLFMMYETRLEKATCQLYSDRMRGIFVTAYRDQNVDILEDAVTERVTKEHEVRDKIARLRGKDGREADPWAEEEIRRLEEEWTRWE